jgi:hypothetical protein
MHHIVSRRTAAQLFFIIGLLLMFLGTVFLIVTLTNISRISAMTSFIFIVLGLFLAFFAIQLKKRSLYFFFAAFFLQIGLFLFLAALGMLPIPFSKSWPLISVFSGLALFPAGWHRYGALRSRYVVPSIVFLILGSVLMIFSLDVVPFSFTQFIIRWWSLLVVLAGLTLILVSLGTNKENGEMKK